MSAIASTLRKYWVEIAWGVFTLLCLSWLFGVGEWETIPFHLVWVSMALVYGFRFWRLGTTAAVASLVTIVTGAALLRAAAQPSGPGLDEVAEVPLMGLMFAAMVWHTERVKRLVEERERLYERQREFVRDASHGLRTPITVARGHAELLRDSLVPGTARADAEIVLDELDRLSRLSDRLLLIAASEHPRFLVKRPIDVLSFIERTMARWSVAANRGWRVGAVVDGVIDGDEVRLEIVVDALIENAVKATDEGGAIELATSRRDGSLVITVRDHGPGLDPALVPQLFQRFVRGETDGAVAPSGTGLGLAAARAIVEAHGGSIAASNAVGGGAVFEIVLPGLRSTAVGSSRPRRRASAREDVVGTSRRSR